MKLPEEIVKSFLNQSRFHLLPTLNFLPLNCFILSVKQMHSKILLFNSLLSVYEKSVLNMKIFLKYCMCYDLYSNFEETFAEYFRLNDQPIFHKC